MREIRVDSGSSHVTLGRVGENRVAQLLIDTSDWAREFPGGRLALFIERPDGRKYIAAVENSGGSWAYTLTSADLAMAGRGRMQLQWMVDEQIARSKILDTVTMPSIMASEGPPGYPEQGYLEQVEAIEQAGYQTASQVESAITGKGYQNASQVESIITGKGYQTSEQVEAAITEKGYQTSEQVESAITGKGYQTAAQVAEAISGAGHLSEGDVTELSEEDIDEILNG